MASQELKLKKTHVLPNDYFMTATVFPIKV